MTSPRSGFGAGIQTDAMTTEQRQLYDALRTGPRWREGSATSSEGFWPLPGPFGPMLLSPAVGAALQEVGLALRFHGSLPEPLRELATIAVAAACGSDYELSRHLPLARRAGVSEADLAKAMAVVRRPRANVMRGTRASVRQGPSTGRSNARDHWIDSSEAADAVVSAVAYLLAGGDRDVELGNPGALAMELLHCHLGPEAAFELVVLVGYYEMLATILSVYGIEKPGTEAGSGHGGTGEQS